MLHLKSIFVRITLIDISQLGCCVGVLLCRLTVTRCHSIVSCVFRVSEMNAVFFCCYRMSHSYFERLSSSWHLALHTMQTMYAFCVFVHFDEINAIPSWHGRKMCVRFLPRTLNRISLCVCWLWPWTVYECETSNPLRRPMVWVRARAVIK